MAGIVAVGHVGLAARDLESLTRFYRETVGLRQTVYHRDIVAIFEVGDADFFLMPGAPELIGFDLAADDVDAFRARLVEAGVECAKASTSRTTGHRSFSFVDPEGNAITVTSAHPRSAGRGGQRAR